MSYSKDVNSIQHMLGILLQMPDPNQMLRHSKPLDRNEGQIKVIEQGTIQKYKWQGALPSKLRDEKLHLNYDRQMNKAKNSLSQQNNSQQLHHQNSSHNRRDFNQLRYSNKLQNQSFSVDNRSKDFMFASRYNNFNNSSFSNHNQDENASLMINQNQSAFIQQNNFFDHSITPNSTTNRKYAHQHSLLSPTRNLLSPKNNPFHNNHIHIVAKDKSQQHDPKQVSIKYIGVLSRKIPMEQQVEKLTKCKLIQQERRVKSGTGVRSKGLPLDKPLNSQEEQSKSQILEQKSPNQKNKITINIKASQKKPQNEEQGYEVEDDTTITNENHLIPMSEESRNQLLNISQKLYEIQENVEMENKHSQLELKQISIQESQEKKRLHQNALRQVLEEQDTSQKQLGPISPMKEMRFSQDNNRKPENTHSTISSTQYQRFYGNPIPRNDKNSQELHTSQSRPSTTTQSRAYYNYIGQQTPTISSNQQQTQNNYSQQSQRAQSLNQQRRVIVNDQLIEKLPENNYINVERGSINSSQSNPFAQTQEMPDPSKYDKFIVTKYSLERKLTALKKKREDNPNYTKKQFFVVWNNQQINCLNN